MADIDPLLSPHLCVAVEAALSLDFQRPLQCIDVSRQKLAWDLEARDHVGAAVLRISHTLATWEELRKADAEMNDIRVGLEKELAADSLRDLVISVTLHEPPKNSTKRREFAAGLAGFIRAAAATLRDAPFGSGVDVRQMADDPGDPGAVQLRTTLSKFRVDKISLGGPAIISAADTRFFRWQPPVSAAATPRLEAKLKLHGAEAQELILLIEVEDADMSQACIQDWSQHLEAAHRRFRALY